MFDEICPHCNTSKCIPQYVKQFIKMKGSKIVNFRCCHCNETIKVFGFRTVHFGTVAKSDHSDFEIKEIKMASFEHSQHNKRIKNHKERILEAENKRLRQLIKDTVDGMECLETCDSYGHDELCPVVNPTEAWRKLREENEQIRQERDAYKKWAHDMEETVDRIREAIELEATHYLILPDEVEQIYQDRTELLNTLHQLYCATTNNTDTHSALCVTRAVLTKDKRKLRR